MPGHPRLYRRHRRKTWMPGPSPGMTWRDANRVSECPHPWPTVSTSRTTPPPVRRCCWRGMTGIAFGRRTMPVDGNIERVVSRLFAVEEPLPQAKPLIQQLAATLLAATRAGDSAQALMDLGSTICTPKKPACALCPLNDDCLGFARGDQETFPRKAAKKTGVPRRGAAFVVMRGGELLVRTRAEKGLLGGMTEVPTSRWLAMQHDKAALGQAPRLKDIARWQRKQGTVTHVFTHFPLELVVYTASIPTRARAPTGMRWVSIATPPA